MSGRHGSGHPIRDRSASTAVTFGLAVAAGAAAITAPAAFTGRPLVDAVERFLVASLFTWVVAHGRRSTLLVTSALLLPVARGPALLLLFVSLAASVFNLTRPRRSKEIAAIAAGTAVNAALHLPPVGLLPGIAAVIVLIEVFTFIAAARHLRRRHRRIVRIGGAVLSAAAFIAVILTGVAAIRSAPSVRAGADGARAALEAVRDGDTTRAARRLDEARTDLLAGEDVLGTIGIGGRLLPVISQQLGAVETAVVEARTLTDLADDLLSTDYADLRYEGGLALDQLTDLVPRAVRVEEALEDTGTRLATLRSGPLLPGLRGPIEEFHDTVLRANGDVRRATSILPELPGLLGGDGPRRYLLVFITPAELRGAGGFIGSWAELQFVDGRADLHRSGRIRDLIDYGGDTDRVLEGPDDYRRRYGRFRPEYSVQDATMSPNWPSNAEVLASIYPQAGGEPVDGVIGIDPIGLAALLQLTGPVTVPDLDEPLTSDNAAQFLLRDQYLQFGDRAVREDVLADSTEAIFDTLTKSALPSPRTLGDVLGPIARGRHMQVWAAHPSEQELMAELGADGSLRFPDGGDGWQIVQQNVGNNKLDAYLRRVVDYDMVLDPATETVRGTITVTLHNEPPALDLPPAVVGNTRGAPVGTNMATLALHGRSTVTELRIDGEPTAPGRSSEIGYAAWDTPVLRIPPDRPVVVEFDVEHRIDLDRGYHLRVLPQPVARADEIRIRARLASGAFTGDVDLSDGFTVEHSDDELRVDGPLEELLDVWVPLRR